MSESRAFDRLSSGLQRWLWNQNWAELREIQEAAVEPILAGRDVVIASPTASGKTEAAFLPICSRISHEPADGLRALCIAPLKALINDQHRRLESLAEAAETIVTPWHGDVAAGRKRRLRENPQGILLITPESLEALFVGRGTAVPRFFAGLSYVVVDELHAFIGTERGRQLQSLLHRLESAIARPVPRIGLSATLGDLSLAADYLRPGSGGNVVIIESSAFSREIRLQIRGFRVRHSLASAADADDNSELEDRPVPGDAHSVAADLFNVVARGTHLVFANSRANVERYSDLLTRQAIRIGAATSFHPHHGSLSKELRDEAETALRSPRDATVIATTTLELGIDIGAVDTIAQIGPPPSVASLRQRLGRSGRGEGRPSVVRIYIQEDEILPRSPLLDQLRPSLVEAIAMVQLLIARWVEPPTVGALHLSTLVQQLLSLIAQRGGTDARSAFRTLCATGPFSSVDSGRFAQLLRDLGNHDLIAQMHDGTLVLGLAGERLVSYFDFYAAFVTPEEWRLLAYGKALGTIPVTSPITLDSFLIFGGKRWRIIGIDEERRTIELTRAPGGNPPVWGGDVALVHARVRQEMRRVYTGIEVPVFLNDVAKSLLAEGRECFARAELHRKSMIRDGRDTLLFPWDGDRVLDTIALALRREGIEADREGMSVLVVDRTPEQLRPSLARMVAAGPPDPLDLAAKVENLRTQKHHRFLGRPLLQADFASDRLDVPGAWAAIRRVLTASEE